MEDEIHYTGGIITINLAANYITCEGVKHLLNFPKQLINKLKILDLSNNKLDSESCGTLACLIPHVPHLKSLILDGNPNIGHGGAVPLITSLITSLEDWNYSLQVLSLESEWRTYC